MEEENEIVNGENRRVSIISTHIVCVFVCALARICLRTKYLCASNHSCLSVWFLLAFCLALTISEGRGVGGGGGGGNVIAVAMWW